jgi:hypothetical protein
LLGHNEHEHGCLERHRLPFNMNPVTGVIDTTTKQLMSNTRKFWPSESCACRGSAIRVRC